MSDDNVQQRTQKEDKDKLKRPTRNMGKRVGYGLIVLALVGIVAQQLWTLRVWDVLQREEVTVPNVDKQLVSNEGSLQRQKNEIDGLREMLLHDRLLLQLDRLEDQMDAGWQLWLITGDSQRLVQSIEQGQRWLLQVPGAEAHALRMALTRDLVDIRSRQSLDLRDTTQQLDGVIASIDKLPLKQERRIKNDVTSEVPAVASSTVEMTTLMEKSRAIATELATEVWHSIRRMIRVQRLDQTEQALLAPEQKIFLQQGLRMLLLDARHALVQRNTPLYQQSLSQAGFWLSKYFDDSDALVQQDLSLLKTLMGINVDPAAIRFDQTRQALELLRSSLSEHMLSPQVPADASEDTLVPGNRTPADSAKGDAT
jgi:uncharacterized protein HemX